MAAPELGHRYPWFVRMFSPSEKRQLYAGAMQPYLQEPGDSVLVDFLAQEEGGAGELDRILFADTMTYLPDDLLVKMDLATMAHSLEARSPLLDHEVLETAASMPEDMKLRNGSLKWALKEAFRELLPREIDARPKRGFGIPLDDWMRGSLGVMAKDLMLCRTARIRSYTNVGALERLFQDHESGRLSIGRRLWCLLMLELWNRHVVEYAWHRETTSQAST